MIDRLAMMMTIVLANVNSQVVLLETSSGPVASIGYVFFSKQWAQEGLAAGFIKASRETKQIMNDFDEEWDRLSSSGAIKDSPEALLLLRDRFRERIPSRAHDDEVFDAGVIYGVLSELGGKKLVGNATVMTEGTYWYSVILEEGSSGCSTTPYACSWQAGIR